MNNIKFYNDTMGNEQLICSCSEKDFIAYPNIGDMVSLPLDVPIETQDVYVVKQKYIEKDAVSYFCKLYSWED
nr:MAG TPA: hypothetical protein [Caudoviricetes sp.]